MVKLSDDEIEARAEALRLELKMASVEKLNVFSALEGLKYARFLRDFIVVPNHILGDAAARFNSEEKRIYLSETTDRLARLGDPRAVWTVAHEIGHLALGHGTRDRKTNGNQSAAQGERVGSEEVDAHRFAAALLAPSRLAAVTEDVTAESLANRFGLSNAAAERRRQELLRDYRRKNGIRRPLPSTVVDFLSEAARRGHIMRPAISEQLKLEPAKKTNYEGDPCPNPNCGELRMIRTGLQTVCEACGTKTGRD